jgi:hypothetical protein
MPLAARRVLFLITVVLFLAGVAGVVLVSQSPNAQSALDEARAFVQRHPSVRFVGTVNTVQIAGEVESRARAHAVLTAADDAIELVALDDTIYRRSATTPGELANAKYDKFEADATSRRKTVAQREDIDVAAWLAAAHHPTTTHRGGGLTSITADVDVPKLYGAAVAKDIDWMTLRLTVRDGGEIRSLVLATRDDSGTLTVTLRFADWGSRVDVAAPPADQVVANSAINAEKVAAFTDAPLYMPKTLPPGWKLVRADVLSEDETTEGCAQVALRYADPAAPESRYLSLYEFPVGYLLPFDGKPFTAGKYRGYHRSTPEGDTLVQMTVGGTTLQAQTTLSVQELAALLQNLAQLRL